VAFRFLTLMIFAAGAHFADGLAFVALGCGALVGWRAWPFFWLAIPPLALAIVAAQFYANSTGTGKSLSALGNFPFELIVFAALTAIGFGLGHLVRRHGRPSSARRSG
jgi:hypothetical protein